MKKLLDRIPFYCAFCNTKNTFDALTCAVCGAAKGARVNHGAGPAAIVIFGVMMLFVAVLLFYTGYPPGSLVKVWNGRVAKREFYSSAAYVRWATGVPMTAAMLCFCALLWQWVRSKVAAVGLICGALYLYYVTFTAVMAHLLNK